jgi:hypothetical protein
MGGACSAHRGDEKCIHILVGKPEGKKPLKDLNIDGRMILK